MDLLEQQSKEKAHLPIQDVLSIFFQVSAPSGACMLRRTVCLDDQTHDQWCLLTARTHHGLAVCTCSSVRRLDSPQPRVQVCCAVQVLHQQQPALAHRDVKPHNVLIRHSQPGTVAMPKASSSAASGSQRESGQLKSNGETEPLQSSHAGHSRTYHAVLMV